MDTYKTQTAKSNDPFLQKGLQKTKDLVSHLSTEDVGQLAISLEQSRSDDARTEQNDK
jgi:hypothetical protein